jgi:UDP-N-acetylglucosamine acyltransferase
LAQIHPTAIIDSKARIGENVSIGAFSIVEGDVDIGEGTSIASHVVLNDGTRIGKNCTIHKGANVASIPQDLKFGGEESLFIIGDSTTIREFATLNRGTNELGKSQIGSNCLLMAYTHVAHDCVVGDNVIMANGVQIGGHVEIHDHAIIGGMTPVHQFCKVGAHCMVGGAYRVVQDVPPFITVTGEPLKYAGLNSVGLRRRGFDPEALLVLKRAYRFIFRSKLNLKKAVQKIKDEIDPIPEVQSVLDFIEKSNRGLI